MKTNTIWLILLVGLPLTGARAQMIQSLWHAHHVGYRLPGEVPKEKLVIQLPAIGLGLYNSGFSTSDLIGATTNGVTEIDVDGVLNQLDPDNQLMIQGGVQTLGVGWKMGKLWMEVGHAVRYENFFNYPRDVFGVFFKGNAAYIGQTADLGLKVNSMVYSELYGGIAGQIGRVSFGGRLKWLNGAVSARTERSTIGLYTSDDVYQLTINTDYLLHTSPELGILQGDGTDITLGSEDYSFDKVISHNSGLSIDLGVEVGVGDHLQLSVSVMDLGSIWWKDDVVSYRSQKTIQYDGYDFSNLFTDDSLSLAGALDTLQSLLEFDEETGGEYRTFLPWTFQVGARYRVNDWLNLSGVLFGQKQASYVYSGFSLGGNVTPLPFLETGLTYTLYDHSYANIGAHLLLKLGPVRVYAASDNLFTLFAVDDSQFANGRAGLQLAF